MKTLSELTQAEREQRERAGQYEWLLGQRANLRSQVERLASEAINLDPDVCALSQIVRLVKDIPVTLVTRNTVAEGRPIVPGGQSVCDMLIHIAETALIDLQNKEAKRVRNLEDAKAKLAEVEKGIAEVEAAEAAAVA